MTDESLLEIARLHRDVERRLMRGDIVARTSDPVHVGQIIHLSRSERSCTVCWLESNWIESRVALDELHIAQEWKT